MTDQTADLFCDAKCETGESPVWNEVTNQLWWTDIPGKQLHKMDLTSGLHSKIDMPGRVGCFAFRQQEGLILAMEHGFYSYDPEQEILTNLADPEADMTSHRFNDGRCDRQGRFLAGSMNLSRDKASAKLWQLTTGNAPRAIVHDLLVANGLAFSAKGDQMYLVDGGRRQIFRFNYDEDGTPTDQTVFQEKGTAPGGPDGGAIDADGCYWSARWNGGCVVRFTPDGQIDQIIKVPVSRVTMCAFGGADLKTLFITTAHEGMTEAERLDEPLAGAVFAAQPGVQGIAEPRFAG